MHWAETIETRQAQIKLPNAMHYIMKPPIPEHEYFLLSKLSLFLFYFIFRYKSDGNKGNKMKLRVKSLKKS